MHSEDARGGRVAHVGKGSADNRLRYTGRVTALPGPNESAANEQLAQASEQAPRWRHLVDRLFPWASLVVSCTGAALMDHSEARGGMIAIAAAVSWLAFVLVAVLHRPARFAAPPPTRWQRFLRFGSTFANQSLLHYSLLFSAPFYFEACAFTPLQCVFVAWFVLAVAIASWDPWCARVLLSPLFGSLLLAFASFVGWNAALPMLGVPHRISVWISALFVGVGIPIVNLVSGVTGPRRAWSIAIGAALPILLLLGGIAALPPAPLRVVQAQLGTSIVERQAVGVSTRFRTVPSELVCWTAIRAPRGLKDALFHVWSRDGTVLSRVPVEVRGGRRAGFRTWSRQRLPNALAGHYRCDVVTALGQTLGGVSADVGS
ncbi:MAG: hypothetical protein JWN04_2357 [Myxococcaceae bacterium]|nr:hypothetical protein [Myxococcaceae bacterium]